MRVVADRRAGGAFAGAEVDHAGAVRLPFHRLETGALVRTVAERLRLRAPAAAPPIALTRFDADHQRRPAADFGFAHAAPPASVASHASPQAFASSRTRKI